MNSRNINRSKSMSKKNNSRNSTRINPIKRYDKNNSANSNGPINRAKAAGRSKNKKDKSNNKKHTVLKRVILIGIALIFLVILIFAGIFAGIVFSDKFALTKEDLLIGVSNTIIYDADGNVIAELSGKENRKIIK